MNPSVLFGRALDDGHEQLTFRSSDGVSWPMAIGRWLAPACPVDERVLARACGPVLDVGCGPGRHVQALARRGVVAVGVEIAPVAVRHARQRGAEVVEGSIFEVAPDPGQWNTALLLDGNIGIGGRPERLLRRIAGLLSADGRILVEVEPPTSGEAAAPGPDAAHAEGSGHGAAAPKADGPCRSHVGSFQVRIEAGGTTSAWFPWARVTADAIVGPAAGSGMRIVEAWCDEGRHFCTLASA